MNTTIQNITRSFIIVPLVATTLSMNVFTTTINQRLALSDATAATSAQESKLQADRLAKATKIDAYFAKHKLPLAGYGMTMVLAAEEHDIDPYLIPAIAMRESTGCKFIIPGTYNCFGWGGGKIKFASYESAIKLMAKHLGGNSADTAHYYGGKSIKGILETYNPPSVVATYASEVMSIMASIEKVRV